MRSKCTISWNRRNNLTQCYLAIDLNKYVKVEKAARMVIASSNTNIKQTSYRS